MMAGTVSEIARAVPRALGDEMAERLLRESPQPLVEGGSALRVLETRRRYSQAQRCMPVLVLQLARRWWLVAPNREAEWMHDLQTYPRWALRAGHHGQRRHAVVGLGGEAVMVIGQYLSVALAPWEREDFPLSANASRRDIAEHLDAMAVFRLDR